MISQFGYWNRPPRGAAHCEKRGIMNIRRVLVLCVAAALVGSGSPALFAQAPPKVDKKAEEKRSKNQQEDVTALVQLVDQVSTADPAGSPADQAQGDVEIKWNFNHFMRARESMAYVPFELRVDRADLTSPNAAIYIRAVSRTAAPAAVPAAAAAPASNRDRNQPPAARPVYAWEFNYFVNVRADGAWQRAMELPAGEYDVFVAVKDQSTGDKKQVAKTGLLRKRLTVPDYKAPGLVTSSIIAGGIEEMSSALSAQQQQENPFVFGLLKLVPSVDAKFAKMSELTVIFLIYGAEADPVTTKPNVTVEYSFHQKTGETEKYFNKTSPQDLNAQTLPPDFSLAAGHQLQAAQGVPLASFPAGDYRLEIKVTDKAAGKSVTRNVNFTVNAS